METIHKLTIWGAVLLVFAKILRGAKALNVSLRDYQITTVDVAAGTLGMNLYFTIVNPLWVGITLREISGTLTANSGSGDEVIGTVNTQYNYYIRGNASHVIRATLIVQAQGVLRALAQNISSGNINNLFLTFDGKLVFGDTYRVPITFKRTMSYNELKAR